MDRKNVAVFLLLFLLNLFLVFCQPLYKDIYIDEGQYLFISKKMVEGWVPYRDIAENKPLGMYISIIPVILLCGKDVAKIRVCAAFMMSLAMFFVYLIGKKLGNLKTGLLAAVIMAFITAFPGLSGYAMLTDPVANLFIAAMFYCLICLELGYTTVFLVGMLFAAACSVRQTCILIIIPVIYEFCSSKRKLDRGKSTVAFVAGTGLVLAPMLLYLVVNSAVYDAVYWMFFSLIESGGWSSVSGITSTWIMLAIIFSPFLLLTLIGLEEMGKRYRTILLWLLIGLIIAIAGFNYWHNYLFVAPPFSILASIGVENIFKFKGKMRKEVFTGLVFFMVFTVIIFLIFEFNLMGNMPFSPSPQEQQDLGRFIKANTAMDDRIFMFGINSDVYYLSDRDPATKMSFFGGSVCNMSKEEEDEFIFNPLGKRNTKYALINHLNIVNMCGNESRIEGEVMDYVNANYVYVNSWGPLNVYARKNETV